MELACDFKTIENEDLLKKMWQQTEDISRRKEIQSHLYKIRESRLRDLYREGSDLIMSDKSGAGFGKDPLAPCHGDSLVDQSFQSLKSKEVRDSMSPPHDMKFHALSLNQPNTTGWDVQTSSEVSPDGRAYRTETLAKTDGIEKINGGVAEFQGRNEQHSSASHTGDDKNFVKKASESSKTHLQENVVIGDENSGRTEMKSSSKTSSSSQVVSSSSTVYQDGNPQENNYLMDDQTTRQHVQNQYQQQREQQRLQQEQYENLHRQQHQQQQQHQRQEQLQSRQTDQSVSSRQHQTTEQYNRNLEETNTSTNVETDQTYEENKRYIDMDKASPEYQQRVQFLMAQPGEIISSSVEYPKPNVKMILTVKRLPDGTIVRNKRYETEELRPAGETTRQRQVSNTNQTNTQSKAEKRIQDQENIYSRLKNTRDSTTSRKISPTRSPRVDSEPHGSPMGHPSNIPESQSLEQYTDDVSNIATFSSVKKSSRRFSTETTSETIEEVEDRPSYNQTPSKNKHITSGHEPNDFTTHGFPSVRANKPTQEYPSDRPHAPRENFRQPNVNQPTDTVLDTNKHVSGFPSNGFPSMQPPATMDGDVVFTSERTRSSKQKTNTERVVETEIVTDGDYNSADNVHQTEHHTRPDFSTHGFPSVKTSSPLREGSPKTFQPSSPRRSQPNEDFSTHGFPSVKASSPLREGSPGTFQPSSPRRSQPNEAFSTHGFPSVKSPQTPNYRDTPTKGFPATKEIPVVIERQSPSSTQRKPQGQTPNATTTKKQSTTTEASTNTVRKEKEVDAAHRAFAASLRSSSPVDNTRRDSYSDQQRYTPRSSIASSKNTYKRDMREGSHESTVPSETSRVSTSTVTRQSPGKSVGKTTLTKQTVVKSNETLDITPQRIAKSPSPAKTITTTTTIKKTSVDVPKSEKSPYSPASNSSKPRTHPKNKSPFRDDHPEDLDEPNHESPNISDIEPLTENEPKSLAKQPDEIIDDNSSPSTSYYPENKITPKDSIDSNQIKRERTGKTEETILDTNRKDYPKNVRPTDKKPEPIYKHPVNTEITKTDELLKHTNRQPQEIRNIKTVAGDFISKESINVPHYNERPDGALASKEPIQPTSPTYHKKGLSRSETFEERCRQILGMEDSGDTQGSYAQLSDVEKENEKQPRQKKVPSEMQTDSQISEFVVRIEDCDDDEANYISESKINVNDDTILKTTVIQKRDIAPRKTSPKEPSTKFINTDKNKKLPEEPDYDSETSVDQRQDIEDISQSSTLVKSKTTQSTQKSHNTSVSDISRTSSPERAHSPVRTVKTKTTAPEKRSPSPTTSRPRDSSPLGKSQAGPSKSPQHANKKPYHVNTRGEPEPKKPLEENYVSEYDSECSIEQRQHIDDIRQSSTLVTTKKTTQSTQKSRNSSVSDLSRTSSPERKHSPLSKKTTEPTRRSPSPTTSRPRESSPIDKQPTGPSKFPQPGNKKPYNINNREEPVPNKSTEKNCISEYDSEDVDKRQTSTLLTTKKTMQSTQKSHNSPVSDLSRTSSPERKYSPVRTVTKKTTEPTSPNTSRPREYLPNNRGEPAPTKPSEEHSVSEYDSEDIEDIRQSSTLLTIKKTTQSTKKSCNSSVSDLSRTSSPERKHSPVRTVTKKTMEQTRRSPSPTTARPRESSPFGISPTGPLKSPQTSNNKPYQVKNRVEPVPKKPTEEHLASEYDSEDIEDQRRNSTLVTTKKTTQSTPDSRNTSVSGLSRTSSPERKHSPVRAVPKITPEPAPTTSPLRKPSTRPITSSQPSNNFTNKKPLPTTSVNSRKEPVSEKPKETTKNYIKPENDSDIDIEKQYTEDIRQSSIADYTRKTTQRTHNSFDLSVSDTSRVSSPERQQSPVRAVTKKETGKIMPSSPTRKSSPRENDKQVTKTIKRDQNNERTLVEKTRKEHIPLQPTDDYKSDSDTSFDQEQNTEDIRQSSTLEHTRKTTRINSDFLVTDTSRTLSPERQHSPDRTVNKKIPESKNRIPLTSTSRIVKTSPNGKTSNATKTPQPGKTKTVPKPLKTNITEPKSQTITTVKIKKEAVPKQPTEDHSSYRSEYDSEYSFNQERDTEDMCRRSTIENTKKTTQKTHKSFYTPVSDVSRTSSPDRNQSPVRTATSKTPQPTKMSATPRDRIPSPLRATQSSQPNNDKPSKRPLKGDKPLRKPTEDFTNYVSEYDSENSIEQDQITEDKHGSYSEHMDQQTRITERSSHESCNSPVSDRSRISSPERKHSPSISPVRTMTTNVDRPVKGETPPAPTTTHTRKPHPREPSFTGPTKKPLISNPPDKKSQIVKTREEIRGKTQTNVTDNSAKTTHTSVKKSTGFDTLTKRAESRKSTPVVVTTRKPSKDTLPLLKTPRKEQPSNDESKNTTPDVSPTRSTERRRSSNISVHTEIIIEHSGSRSPKNEPKQGPTKITKIDDDLINRSLLQRQNKKFSVTERKESAPVHRVTRKDKDVKMSRSTSENVIKSTLKTPKKPVTSVFSPTTSKPDRRPSKCLTTKSINLTTMDRLLNSEDMENVIIDIQHAKSSREPSPDKIIPTPVSIDLDTGKPRYPDVVQEPEDEPRRKTVVKNIPIFEEASNDFIGCQIMEVNINKVKEHIDKTDYTDEILNSPTVEAPQSLDYQSLERTDDVCLLSVHDKVSKFTHTAEETKKPKTSGKFYKDVDRSQNMPEDDECLLTVDQKVNKFLKTAEKITNETYTSTKEIEIPVNKNTHKSPKKANKLAPTMPQRSPELVAKIERQISRQNEPDWEPSESSPTYPEDVDKNPNDELLTSSTNWNLKKGSMQDKREDTSFSEYKTTRILDEDELSEELVPMTKSHTTAIELKRQKDILSRPSVFNDAKRKPQDKKPVVVTTGVAPKIRENVRGPGSRTPVTSQDRARSPVINQVRTKSPQTRPVNQPPNYTDDSEDHTTMYETELKNEKTDRQNVCTTSTTLINNEKNLFKNSVRTNVVNAKSKFEPSNKSEQYVSIKNVRQDDHEVHGIDYENEETTEDNKQPRVKNNISNRPLLNRKPSDDRQSPVRKSSVEPLNEPKVGSHCPKRTPYHSTKSTTTKITERTVKHIPNNQRPTRDETEQILDNSNVTAGKPNHSTDSVAARRNIFERGDTTTSSRASPAKSTTPTGRRPSYMDHTKSSLEHTRRDSLEFNKSNYSRKTSFEDETQYEHKPNTAVKFDLMSQRSHTGLTTSTEEINIEEIFDLYTLEQMLETVTSYEIRRRIRAQIRLVKKNMQNLGSSTKLESIVATEKTSTRVKTSKHHEEIQKSDITTNSTHETKTRDRSTSPVHLKRQSTSPTTRRISSPQEQPRKTNRAHYPTDEQIDSPYKEPSPRDRSSSPEGKTTTTHKETRLVTNLTTMKSHAPTQKPSSSTPKDNTNKSPIWVDRKNVLKNPSKSPKPSTTSTTRTVAKTTSTSQRRNQAEDSITSSYGIGPTDENGLPLFGIRALKKKPQSQPSEATKEVTGYVVEEKYYSENQSQPIVERKQLIYSTDADQLEEIQRQLKCKTSSVERTKQSDKKYIDYEPSNMPEDSQDMCTTSSTTTKYVRRGSVKEMSEKFIRKESSQSVTEKTSGYPKAGLILRTNSRSGATDDGDSYEVRRKAGRKVFEVPTSDDDEAFGGEYVRKTHTSHISTATGAESETESESVNINSEVRSQKSTRSFLNSSKESKVVTGVDDLLERMRNADNVVEVGDTQEDQEARALLNKFLGASAIMSGVETMLPTKQTKMNANMESDNFNKQQVKTTRVTQTIKSGSSSSPVARKTCDIEEIWDEEILKQLLEQATSYEERRSIRTRLRQLMAERDEHYTTTEKSEVKEEDGAVVTTTTKVTTRTVSQAPKSVSPFAKFKQLDKQNSLQAPKSPSTPTTPGGSASGSAPIFRFTDPALNARAATVKDQLLQWCQIKTKEYENVQVTNFSTSWSDGLAFCALIHHFLPEAFDYSKLTPQTRRHNFELAFTVADEKAGIAPLLDVEDMVVMKRPDWKCVFVYVQSIYRRFRNCQ